MTDLSQYSEFRLISQYSHTNDEIYFAEFFNRHHAIAYQTAFRITKNQADAEDIVQIAFVEVIKTRQRLTKESSFPAWILQIVVNRSKDKLRSNKARVQNESKRMPKQTIKPELISDNKSELSKRAFDYLNEMPSKYSEPISLNLIEHLSIREISFILSKPEQTIRTQISRGLTILKSYFKSSGVVITIAVLSEIFSGENIYAQSIPYNPQQKIKDISQTLKNKKEGISFTNKILISSLSLILFSYIIFHFSDQFLSKDAITANAMPVLEQPKEFPLIKWNFDSNSPLKNIRLRKGKPFILKKDEGRQGSNALFIPATSVVDFDLSNFKFPIKVTYYKDFHLPTPRLNFEFCYLNYKRNQKLVTITTYIKSDDTAPKNATGKYSKLKKKWMKKEAYITKKGLYFFRNGKSTHFIRMDIANLKSVALYSNIDIFLDDLQVEEIKKDELPINFNLLLVESEKFRNKPDGYDYILKEHSLKLKCFKPPSVRVIHSERIEELYLPE